MSLTLAILVVVGFAFIIDRTGVVRHSKEAGSRARASLKVVTDPSLEDDSKERQLRQESLRLFGLLGRIVLASGLAVALPLVAVWLLGLVGLGSFGEVLAVLARIDFLLAVGVAGCLGYGVIRLLRGR